MSTVGSALMDCPDVQAELNQFFGSPNCDPALLGFPSPFNEFLWNPINRRGVQQVLNPMPGKKKIVQLRYDQAIPISQVTTGTSSDITCTATTERGDLTTPYELGDDVLFFEEKMTPAAFINACRSNPEIILRKIALLMKAMREATYKKTADEFVSGGLWGEWGQIVKDDDTNFNVNAGKELEVATEKPGTDDPNAFTMETIDGALMQTNYCDTPFITGGFDLYKYFRRVQAGCCATNGIDIAKMISLYGRIVTWDKYLQAASAFAGTDLSVALMPGALQVIYYNQDETIPEMRNAVGLKVGANYDTMVIVDPVSGMPMNLRISDNCGVISIIIWTNTKLIAMPADMFAVGDDLEGVTFVNKIKVVNA